LKKEIVYLLVGGRQIRQAIYLVAKVSTDAGQTFGSMLMLAGNGIIGEAEGTEEGK
jgi:hypothetical protein